MSAQLDSVNVDAEQCVLGALLLHNAAFFRVFGLIQPQDFYRREHRLIYTAISEIVQNGSEADVVTVAEYLQRGGELEAVGGLSYIGTLANSTPSWQNVQSYAQIVKDRSVARQLRLSLSNAMESLQDQDPEDVITATMVALQNLMQNGTKEESFADAIDYAIRDAKEAHKRRASGSVVGVSTTMPTLDKMTGGFHGPRLIVLGGRPGTFKSALAWQIAIRAAAKGKPAGIVSLEMNASELGNRALANQLQLNGHALATGHLDEIGKAEALDGMATWPVYIDTKSSRLGQIVARIIEWRYKHKIEIAIVDHVQLVHHDKARNRFEELSEVSRQMKLLAMRLDMPILVLSQLSREVEKENRRPRDSDLRECGNLEQDADIILFTHRDKGVGQNNDAYELILSKQRGGAARQIIDLWVSGEQFRLGERG